MKIASRLIDEKNGVVLHLARVEEAGSGRSWWLCDPAADVTIKSSSRESAKSIVESYLIESAQKIKSLVTYGDGAAMKKSEAAMTFADLKPTGDEKTDEAVQPAPATGKRAAGRAKKKRGADAAA